MPSVELPIHRPFIGAIELERVGTVLESRWLGSGPVAREFEERIRTICGARNAVATSSGTVALQIALAACDLRPGDEVVLPSLTYMASSQAVVAAGGRPVYCDVELETANVDPASVAERIGPRTRAIMPVHFGGFPCRMSELNDLARRHDLRVVEDAAHAFGSSYEGVPIGAAGDLICFSFDPVKNVTCGEGGAILTGDDEVAAWLRRTRSLGVDRDGWTRHDADRPWYHEALSPGLRAHLSDVNAAIGMAQLERLDELRARRQALVKRYRENLAGLEEILTLHGDVEAVFPFICAVRVVDGRRDALLAHLARDRIQAWVHYVPNHLQAAFRAPGVELPATERLYDELLSLPLYHELRDSDVDRVAESIRSFYGT